MHIWVKLTNINNMYQSILEIFSKADGTRQIILSHHDVRHTSYGYQETPYIFHQPITLPPHTHSHNSSTQPQRGYDKIAYDKKY